MQPSAADARGKRSNVNQPVPMFDVCVKIGLPLCILRVSSERAFNLFTILT